MSLVWHIVRKDFRRLWLPLSLWLAMVLLHTVLLWFAAGLEATPTAYEGQGYFAGTWQVIITAVGFILAAWLVMEDSLVSSQAFWLTRPISGARLLGAKLAGALLFFCLLPALVLTPVWLLADFSGREWGLAVLELVLKQALVSAVAIILAGVTATPGQFLVRAVGLAVFLPVMSLYFLRGLGDARYGVEAGLAETRFWLVLALVFVTPAGVTVHQFLTRCTWRSCALGALGLILMVGVKLAWPWDLTSPGTGESQERQGKELTSAGVEMVQGQVSIRPHRDSSYGLLIQLEGKTTGIPAGKYLRLNYATAVWVGKDKRRPLPEFFRPPAGSESPPPEVVSQVSGLQAESGSASPWSLEGREQKLEMDWARDQGMRLEYKLDATTMRGQVWGRLPLQVGAELQVGSSYTRITAIVRSEGNLVVRLWEREAASRLGTALTPDGYRPSRRSLRPAEDVFLVDSHSTDGEPPVMATNDIGVLRVNTLMFSQRELILTPPTRVRAGRTEEVPGWEKNIVIVKVRFLPEERFTRRLVADLFGPTP